MTQRTADDGSEIESEDTKDIGDRILDVWHQPRSAFLIGVLVGILLLGMIIFAPADAFDSATSQDIGNNVVTHYQNRAPTGLQYHLIGVEHHGSDLYRVRMELVRGSMTNEESVYVTEDGKWVFSQPPEHVQPQLSE